MRAYWQSLPLVTRIRWLRFGLPVILIPIVIVYQLQVAFRLEQAYGHPLHYAAEISFYSLVGPVVTWLTLIWVERRLAEKDALEQEVRARTRELAGLMAASQDGILSLDHENRITSWNRGASMLFGYATEEILGAPVARILPDFPEILAQGPDERKTWNVETTASGRGRRQITVDLTLTRIGAESGSMPVSLVVMRDITFRKERAAILEEERERISRDLHDGVAQTLYFLALKADVTREQLEADPDSARENLREIGQQARNAIRDVRRAILGLRPMDWANGEFLASLAEFAVSFGHEVGLEVHLNTGDVGADIPSSLEPTLFRLVQESLNNVAKHAGARSVSIQFKPISERARLQVAIRDDGDGFAPDEITRGLGLSQMEQRVYAFGGEFEIVSRQGEGTEIRAEFPIEPARVAA